MNISARIVSLLFAACAMLGLWALPQSAVAIDCVSMGGTSIEGCVAPKVRWKDGWDQIFDDKVSAAYSLYSKSQPVQCTDCNRGIQWSSMVYQVYGSGSCPSGTTHTDSIYTTMTSAGGGATSFAVEMYGYSTQNVCGGTRQKYHTDGTWRGVTAKFVCPEGYKLKREVVDNINEPFGYA